MKVGRTAMIVIAALLAWSAAAQAATPGPTTHRADGNLSDWTGQPTMLAGETRISQGELIYDDYLYDDYGADLNGGPNTPDFRDNLAPTRGDYRYPADEAIYGYNAADLRELRVAADTRGLHLLVFLQTMKVPDATAVTVAIDNNRNRHADEWPLGVGVATPNADQFITFWGTGGWVNDWRGGSRRITRQAVDPSENAIEVDVPWTLLGRGLRGRKVRNLYVVTGRADAAQRQYQQVPVEDGGQPGSTAVFDAGFDADEFDDLTPVGREIGSHWGEDLQAQRLASRDLTAMGSGTVDFGALERGATEPYQPETGHFYDRIFRSGESYDAAGKLCSDPCVNEGINLKQDPNQPGGYPEAQFLSPYQTYGLYIPADYQAGTPEALLLNGHSLDVNHNEYAVVSPNLYSQMGDSVGATGPPKPGRFVITPLARGIDTWYITSGFQDVMEAWADLKAHYSIDDDRTSIGGYSMGGYMTYRMGLLMPDRFASAVAYVGPPAYQLWVPCPNPPSPQPPGCGDPSPSGDYQFIGNTNHFASNGINLPFEMNNSGADELVPAAGPLRQDETFRDVGIGVPHNFYFYPTLDHFALILADEWGHSRDWLNAHATRNETPTEVYYFRWPAADLPQYGYRFDGAYWVDGMVVAGEDPDNPCRPSDSCNTPANMGYAKVYTSGFGKGKCLDCVHSSIGQPYPGPPAPADINSTLRTYSNCCLPSIPNFIEAFLGNLRALTLDIPGAGIGTAQNIHIHFSAAGGPLTLTLQGDFPQTATATFGPFPDAGTPVTVQHTAEGVVVELDPLNQGYLTIYP
jgi:pimeloyl-ACP methyl ester carboxylesterase